MKIQKHHFFLFGQVKNGKRNSYRKTALYEIDDLKNPVYISFLIPFKELTYSKMESIAITYLELSNQKNDRFSFVA